MLIEKLHWRYATKKMAPSRSVPEEKLETILQAIELTPTSSGLQPFEVFVVTDAEIRAKIQPVAWNQSQITEGSHLLVFAAWDNYTADRIDAVTDQMAAERGGRTETLDAYYSNLKKAYLPRDPQINHDHAARQAYIALGFAMTAAAIEEVDCTPMEGFDPDAVDDILGLKDRGLRSVLLLPLGYRAAEGDWLATMKKVRRSRDQFITKI
jgi:nitroreductase